jgi:adenylate kinase
VPKIQGRCDRCGGRLIQRGDDQEYLVRRRFATFERETVPVINYLREKYPTLFFEEDSEAPLLEVQERIRTRLNNDAK